MLSLSGAAIFCFYYAKGPLYRVLHKSALLTILNLVLMGIFDLPGRYGSLFVVGPGTAGVIVLITKESLGIRIVC